MSRRPARALRKLLRGGAKAGLVWLLAVGLVLSVAGRLSIGEAMQLALVWAIQIASFYVLFLLIIFAVERLRALRSRYRQRRRVRRPPWSRTLVVEANSERVTFTPSVLIRGGRPLRGGRVRLRLIDGDRVVRAARGAPLPAAAMGEEIHLPRIDLPAGATADEMLGWQWEVSVLGRRRAHARRRVHARWAEPLVYTAACKTNAEGELVGAPEPVGAPGTARARRPAAAPEIRDARPRTPTLREPHIRRLADAILAGALAAGASDVRLVPQDDRVVVKYGHNGDYRHILDAPLRPGRELQAYLRQMFDLPRERGVAQRGAIAAIYGGKRIDLEGHSIPIEHGDILHICIAGNSETPNRAA